MAVALPGTIGECSKKCLVLFSQSADAVRNLQQDDSSRIRNSFEDEFARFNLWASNIGVFADVHVSLDFRVRDLPDVAELFLRQLDTIEYRLDQLCKDLAEERSREKTAAGEEQDIAIPAKAAATEKPDTSFEEWDLAEILQSIHESIEWLHRLSNLVRKASFTNQNRRAKHFLLRDSEGNESEELTNEMTAGLRNLYDHVIKRNAKGLEDHLIDRVIETMVTRHKRILYRRSRQISYAISQVHYTAQKVATPERSEQLHSLEPIPLAQEPEALAADLRATKVRDTKRRQDKATTVDIGAYRKATAPSRLSRASSIPLRKQDQTLVHPAPKAASEGKDFVCPYCCVILQSREALDHTTWTNHVQKDLDAYICVFEDCDSPYEIYSSSKEWLLHMSTRHRMRWQCFGTDHEPFLYERPEDFEHHMKSGHPGSFPDDQLPFIVEISAQPITPTLEHCPFCSEIAGNLEEHVGEHLREFALHSLPWPDYVEEGSRDGSQSDGMSSNRGTRESAEEGQDSLPPLIFDDDVQSEEISNDEPKRLELYGDFPEIANQHEPLHDNLELLKDEVIATFARSRYGVDSTKALVQLFSASAREGGRVFEDLHIHSEDRFGVDNLAAAEQAPFDASNKQDDPLCLEDTRTEVLKRIRAWTYGEERSCIFWLNGMAGAGKSTIARTISREFSDRGDLGASFFFVRGGGDVGHAGMFFTSIAKQIAIARPGVKQFISEAVQQQPDIASKSRNDQWRKLIAQPLKKAPHDPQHSVLVIVVDALDECDNDNDMKGIVAALAQTQDVASVKLRIIITSRPEMPIRLGFKKMPAILHQDLLLHEQSREIVDADICLFFYNGFAEVKKVHGLSDEWPSVDIVNQLVHLSAGLFIFAATVCRFIQQSDQSPEDSLKLLLPGNDRNIVAAVDDLDEANVENTFFLDTIYSQILERSRPYATYGMASSSTQRETLGAIVTLSEPLPIAALASLLCLRESDVRQRLNRLHSVLHVPQATDMPIRLFSASFRDFLFDRRRCNNPEFFVNEHVAHRQLLQQCIKSMESDFHYNMCNLQHPGVLISEVTQSSIDAHIPLYFRYAGRHWLDHLDHGKVSLDDKGDVHHFLQRYCLYWVEVMSLVDKIPEAMTMMVKLESMVDVKKAPQLHSLARDTLRFMRTFSHVLTKAPLQLYSAGLVFSPAHSTIRKLYSVEVPLDVQVMTQIPDEWNACIQTLEGHSGCVSTVMFSPNGSRVASGSDDKTVRVWDVQTGQCQHTLTGHSDRVGSVVFSPGASRVASSSYDKTVRVWDVQTGQCQHTLEGHSGWVLSVMFSPDGSRVTSGSEDKTVRVWDVQSGQCQHKLEGHSGWVLSVMFSPDGSRVASGSDDKTVRVWDVQTGECLHTFKDHLHTVTSVVFSPDGSQVASGSYDKTVRVWDVQTGQCQHTLEGHSGWVLSVMFSPDGSRVASGSDDKTVRVWDVQTGQCQHTLEGHSGWVLSVMFSPDGSQVASGSGDNTVRVWDVRTGQCEHALEGHSHTVTSVVFSPDGSQVASGSYDKTVRVWDVQADQFQHTLEGHSKRVTNVAFSPDGSRVASGSDDNTVRVWDVRTGQCEHTLEGHSHTVTSVVFSPDGSQVASGSYDRTVRVWDVQTGQCQHTLEGHSGWVLSVMFSPDGSRVASGSDDKTVRVWDVRTGQCQHTLEGHSGWVLSVMFSPDGSQVASGSGDNTVRVWDVRTGQCEHTLKGHSHTITSVLFSPNGSRVASGSDDQTVRVWDVASSTEILYLRTDTYPHEIGFNEDGSMIVVNGSLLPLTPQTLLSNTAARTHGPSLSLPRSRLAIKDSWLTLSSQRMLWLPPEYRPGQWASNSNTVVIGSGTGRVTFVHDLAMRSLLS